MKLSRILASVAAVGLVISPIAAQANTRASESTFNVGATTFATAPIGARKSMNLAGLHRSADETDFTWIILLIAAIIGGVCAATCGGGKKSGGT